jgi:non-reducing end alpha-L-arabinofuranosidase
VDAVAKIISGVVYLANNGGTNPWDTAAGFAEDTSWVIAPPWAPGP